MTLADAVYASQPDDRAWLEGVLHAARPHLDRGLGVCGVYYDISDPNAPRMRAPVFLGTPPFAREAFDAMVANAPRGLFASLLRAIPSCATLSDRLTAIGLDLEAEPLAARVLAPLGVRDFVSFAATEPSGIGCLVGAPLPEITSAKSGAAEGWVEVAAHVTAGIRARQMLRAGATSEAAPVWTSLVAGGWTVVDSMDHTGDRVVVAKRRHASTIERPHAQLSEREREIVARAARGESNKSIAIELGIAPSTVAGHLTSAAAKLGAKTRVELFTSFARSR